MKTASTTVSRGTYGEITDRAITQEFRAVLAIAIAQNKLPAEYFERHSSKSGECLNYDLYDNLGGQWLVQQRVTTFNKYGNSPTKYYYLVRRVGRGVQVTEVVNKATANRAAKQAAKLGDAIRVLRGDKKLKSPHQGSFQEVHTCYKAVALVDGTYRSIYDNATVYSLGKTLIEKAQPEHGGGYYVYATEAEARNAEVPSTSDNLTAPRVLLRCECSGRSIAYTTGKIAYTRCKPVAVVAEISENI